MPLYQTTLMLFNLSEWGRSHSVKNVGRPADFEEGGTILEAFILNAL